MMSYQEQAVMRFPSETRRGQVQHEQSVNKFKVCEMDSLGNEETITPPPGWCLVNKFFFYLCCYSCKYINQAGKIIMADYGY